jgi:hypothetical protein
LARKTRIGLAVNTNRPKPAGIAITVVVIGLLVVVHTWFTAVIGSYGYEVRHY